MGLQPEAAEILRPAGGVAAEMIVFPAHHRPAAVAVPQHGGKILGQGLRHLPVKGQGHHQSGAVLLQQGAPAGKGAHQVGRPAPDIGPGMGLEGDGRHLQPALPGQLRGFVQNGLMPPVDSVKKAQGNDPILFHSVHSLLPKLILQKMAIPPRSSSRAWPIWQKAPPLS